MTHVYNPFTEVLIVNVMNIVGILLTEVQKLHFVTVTAATVSSIYLPLSHPAVRWSCYMGRDVVTCGM